MGDLVPYSEIWRTGAYKNTTLSFSDDVVIEGKTLPAGKYGLYTRPGYNQWQVYLYKKNDLWGLPEEWDDNEVEISFSVNSVYLDFMVETFTILISDLHSEGARLNLLWENTLVIIPFEVPTKAKAMESIEKTMAGNPKLGDYYNAAVYFLQENMDLNQAMKWMDKAIAMRKNPAFWMYRQKSLLHAGLNDKKGAIAAAKKSLELAKAAGNKDYIKMNTESIAEWSK